MGSQEVGQTLFHGDKEAQHSAEVKALRIVDKWLIWFLTESSQPPQCTRIDFLVTHPGPSKSVIWTCEVGECGASLCSLEVHGRNIVALNNVIQQDDSCRFPAPFPQMIPR